MTSGRALALALLAYAVLLGSLATRVYEPFTRGEGLAWLILVLALPVALAATAAGWLAGLVLRGPSAPAAAVVLGLGGVLLELERRPDWLVRYTYRDEDGDDERVRITVEELAQEQLQDLEVDGGEAFPACASDLRRRLRDALG